MPVDGYYFHRCAAVVAGFAAEGPCKNHDQRNHTPHHVQAMHTCNDVKEGTRHTILQGYFLLPQLGKSQVLCHQEGQSQYRRNGNEQPVTCHFPALKRFLCQENSAAAEQDEHR